jgi:hypothetical protein
MGQAMTEREIEAVLRMQRLRQPRTGGGRRQRLAAVCTAVWRPPSFMSRPARCVSTGAMIDEAAMTSPPQPVIERIRRFSNKLRDRSEQ